MNARGSNKKKDILFLSTKYPHEMMLHIKRLLKEESKDESWLLSEEFLTVYSSRYAEFTSEGERLKTASERGIIRGFYEQKNDVLWKQRVHIQKSLLGLVKIMKEYEAVELLESLMYIFGWDLEMRIERKWQTAEEDKIEVHESHAFDQRTSKDKSVNTPVKEERVRQSVMKKEKRQSSQIGGEKSGSVMGKKLDRAARQKGKMTGNQLRELPRERYSRNTASEQTGFYGQNITGSLQGKNKSEIMEILKYALSAILMEDRISDVEYERQLRDMEFRHERLMSLSVRKEAHRAKRGDSRAQCAMGEFYAQENTSHTDYFEAAKWYSFAARQGNSKAKLELGKLFDSEKLLESASTELLLDGRVEAISTKQYGIRYFRELAEEGYPTAQGIMGMKYYFGDGVEKDTAKGIAWLKKAAVQGHVEAQRQLGEIYANIDPQESKKWLNMANSKGDSRVKSRLTK